MSYRAKTVDDVQRSSGRVQPRFSDSRKPYKMTQLPLAVTSWVLDSIDLIGIVNSRVRWGPSQCKVAPGDAVKAMIMAMVMGAYRPALENVAGRYTGQPMELYFESVDDPSLLDPDMLARTLTKLHEADAVQLFATVSAALRARWGIETAAVHSDTTSVSVEGRYENGYDKDGNHLVADEDGRAMVDPVDTMHITHGFSKDHRPDLKQFMEGTAVNQDGIPLIAKPLDGNTADSEWNRMALDLLKQTLVDEKIVYVADSKLINDPLVTSMMDDQVRFLSRCLASFNDKLQSRVLGEVDLDTLEDVLRDSGRKGAAKRRVAEVPVDFNGRSLRALVVETSTFAGKGDKAVEKARKAFDAALSKFPSEYNCQKDAVAAFERFRKKASKGIFDVSAEYVHEVVESRPRGRPRKDGTDIRRADVWTVNVTAKPDAEKEKGLRLAEEHIVLLSNVPNRGEDPEKGMDASEIVLLYAGEWKVEYHFKTKKNPMMVERIFIKDPGRADALVNVINMTALVKAVIQLLIRWGLESVPDEDLSMCGYGLGPLQRKVTTDFFVDSCMNCYIRYDPESNSYAVMGDESDCRARAYLSLIGIPEDRLFTPSLRSDIGAVRKIPARKAKGAGSASQEPSVTFDSPRLWETVDNINA